MLSIILASKSKIRKEILNKHNVLCDVEISNVDEEPIKESLIKEGASPEIISKNLAELKSNKVSQKKNNSLVLGADSVIDLSGDLISKPESRDEALKILKKLNGKKHSLISSVCISKNGSMIWNYSDKAYLTMKNFSEDELNSARKLFKENNWPTIDVTRKSVEETAASVIKIFEIRNKKNA